MPFPLGYWSKRVYIFVAFGLDAGKEIAGELWDPKRKCSRSGPKRPRGSIAKGRRSISRVKRSPRRSSPVVTTLVEGLRLLTRPSFLFSYV